MTDRAKFTDTVARTSRATGQTGVGFALVDLLDAFHPLTTHQFGALVAVAAILVAAVQNHAENAGWIPALFKAVPAAPTPVVDTKPRRKTKDTGLTAVGALLIALIVLLALGLGLGVHPLLFLLVLLVIVVIAL